jgi:double-stranded uracil-DNA glycosylase
MRIPARIGPAAAGERMAELRPIDDVVGPGVRLLLVGINPGRRSAEQGRHFAGPGNRFWPALHAAGIAPRLLGPADQGALPDLGVGITNLCARPSGRADELDRDELRRGGARLVGLVAGLQPAVVAVLGVGAYRRAFDAPRAQVGAQPGRRAGARWWLLHNPSGLNAHASLAEHATGLRAAALAAGVIQGSDAPPEPPAGAAP